MNSMRVMFCGEIVPPIEAEDLAFNSGGACKCCGGTGMVRTVDRRTLIPDENLTIDEGAVALWNSLMWSLMADVCRAMGVRTGVPFKELTDEEKEIVHDGPMIKKHIFYRPKNKESVSAGEMDFTYYSATATVLNALNKVKDENGMKSVDKFLREARRLVDLGLSYLSFDRASSTLSTGERLRTQLARAVRKRTTGMLYVLDEPSIGLHPSNVEGLIGVMDDLVSDGNSIVLVDHDTQVLSHADWLIELGPEAGAGGGKIIAEGSVIELAENEYFMIGKKGTRHFPVLGAVLSAWTV